jgi:hypothetical protein
MTDPPKITGKRPRSPPQPLTWDNTYHSSEQYDFLNNAERLEGTTHVYKLTYSLLKDVLQHDVKGTFYQSYILTDFPNNLTKFYTDRSIEFNTNRSIEFQQNGDDYVLNGKPTHVINGYIATEDIKEGNMQFYRFYIWMKTPSSRINKSVSRSDRRRASKSARKSAKILQSQSVGGSISRKTRRRRSNKTRKSR